MSSGIIIISYVYSNFISINDFYSLGSVLTSSIHIIDSVSDVLFIINITYQSDYPSNSLSSLLVASIVFIVFPVIVSLYQLFYHIKKWQRNDDLGQWITDNITLLYILSVVTGSSFAAIELCTSSCFNLHQFSMPLSQMEINKYQTKRVYSTVLLENIPQFIIQIIFISSIQNDSNNIDNTIVYISMVFSLLSIIISVLSLISRRNILRATDYVSISFDVELTDASKCRNLVRSIKHQFGTSLGVNSNLIKISRPMDIPGGLKIIMHVRMSNTKQIDMNVQKRVNDLHESGRISEILQSSWSLSKEPLISNVVCQRYDSKQRRDNAVTIKSMSQPGSRSPIEMNPIPPSPNSANNQYIPQPVPEPAPDSIPPPPKRDDNYEDSLDKMQFELLSQEVNDKEDKETPGNIPPPPRQDDYEDSLDQLQFKYLSERVNQTEDDEVVAHMALSTRDDVEGDADETGMDSNVTIGNMPNIEQQKDEVVYQDKEIVNAINGAFQTNQVFADENIIPAINQTWNGKEQENENENQNADIVNTISQAFETSLDDNHIVTAINQTPYV